MQNHMKGEVPCQIQNASKRHCNTFVLDEARMVEDFKDNATVKLSSDSLFLQEANLKTCPQIVVATPGRLLDLVEDNSIFLGELSLVPALALKIAKTLLVRPDYCVSCFLISKVAYRDCPYTRINIVIACSPPSLSQIHQERSCNASENVKLGD